MHVFHVSLITYHIKNTYILTRLMKEAPEHQQKETIYSSVI